MVNAIEPIVAKYAGDRPAWGHRKLHWLMWADGHVVSASSVERALRRRDLFQTVGYRGERRELAKARKAAFTAHALGRGVAAGLNETTSGGAWRLTGVTDCFTKVEHGWHISPSGTGADPIAAVEIAITTAWRSRASPASPARRSTNGTSSTAARTRPSPDTARSRSTRTRPCTPNFQTKITEPRA